MHVGMNAQGQCAAADVKDQYKNIRTEAIPEGASLCEPVLWLHWVHIGDFAAISRLSLLVLEMQRFEDLVRSYPRMQLCLRIHAQRFVAAIKVASDPSDRFDTKSALSLA